MNIALWMERAGRSAPDLKALAQGSVATATYGELAAFTACRAGALRATYGLAPGERVAIVADNDVRYVKALFAIWHAGCVAVPVNAKLHPAEIAWILEHSGARLAIVSERLSGAVGAHAPAGLEHVIVLASPEWGRLSRHDPIAVTERAPADPAWLFYTSGTTGRPKGAVLTHGALAAMSQAYALEVDPVMPGDALLHAAPMSHGSGLYMMATVLRLGVNVVPESGGFEAAEVLSLFGAWRNTSMFAAPTMIRRLVEAPGACDPSAIRTIVWGGAPMYVEDAVRAIDRFGPRFAQIYGQGESPMTITVLSKSEIADRDHPLWLHRLASAGRPFGCIEVRIADGDDSPLPDGETGEILCRGPTLMAGYWRNEEASARTLAGGWLHTGDVGSLDAHGYLTLRDRSKDVIISGGSNIYPREVEEVLLRHPGVREVSVIGRPDPEWGEAVVAYVVGEADRAELDALCLGAIARFKRPKDYVFIAALPKNNYGKILKTELRERDRLRSQPG
ncbi:AMP-binding protein [Alsobacter sp. R-9]